jgi:hypothetical protein
MAGGSVVTKMRRPNAIEERERRMREKNLGAIPDSAGHSAFAEKHYTPAEIADMWALSQDAIRRLFRDEPGVLAMKNSKRGTRVYTTMRIPESVAKRVHRRQSGS